VGEAFLLVVLVVILVCRPGAPDHSADRGAGVDSPALRVLYVLGFSINTLTLFGSCCDRHRRRDAIVVVENVERNIEEGARRWKRASGYERGFGPIVAIALVLCSVFVRWPPDRRHRTFYKHSRDHRDLDGDLCD